MSRISNITQNAAAAGRKLLIPYLVAGDPDLKTSLALMHCLVEQGADVIELGIPFSDPSADGPVIQRGVERALSAATTLRQVLDLVAEFRQLDDATAIVLMGYLNPVEIMGYEVFVQRAVAVGVDGVLIVDMPPAEASELHRMLRAKDIDTVFLAAATTSQQRAANIIAHCSGYLYYVSLKGVTGAALTDHASVSANIAKLKELTTLPIAIGFGIKDAESAAAMGRLADGVIIGSALVEQIAQLADQEVHDTEDLIRVTGVIAAARQAMDKLQ